MQDSSIQNARIHAENTVNDVNSWNFASCILYLQCRAGHCDRIRFNPIRYDRFSAAPRRILFAFDSSNAVRPKHGSRRSRSITFDFFRLDAETIGDGFQRLRMRLLDLVPLDPGDRL